VLNRFTVFFVCPPARKALADALALTRAVQNALIDTIVDTFPSNVIAVRGSCEADAQIEVLCRRAAERGSGRTARREAHVFGNDADFLTFALPNVTLHKDVAWGLHRSTCVRLAKYLAAKGLAGGTHAALALCVASSFAGNDVSRGPDNHIAKLGFKTALAFATDALQKGCSVEDGGISLVRCRFHGITSCTSPCMIVETARFPFGRHELSTPLQRLP
jgi:hypothetical protein